ncbi:hypothetical protein KRM28CT15_50010 [Krasilnikovia sp. M28-CT-15]
MGAGGVALGTALRGATTLQQDGPQPAIGLLTQLIQAIVEPIEVRLFPRDVVVPRTVETVGGA